MSFAIVGTVAGVVSIGSSIFGTAQEVEGIRQEANANEAALKFNSAQTRRKAKRVRKVGAEGEFSLRSDVRRQLARNRVSAAASGAEASGSVLDTELLILRDAATDIATLEENTRIESTDLELLADFQLEQAFDVRRAGKKAKKSAILGGFGDVLGKIF